MTHHSTATTNNYPWKNDLPRHHVRKNKQNNWKTKRKKKHDTKSHCILIAYDVLFIFKK
jgi:hypothetical protein